MTVQGGVIQLVEQVDGRAVRGNVAIPVYGFTTADRPVRGGAALPVYIVSQAEVDAGTFRVQGGAAMPVALTSDLGVIRPVLGGAAVPIYSINGIPSGAAPPAAPTGLTAVQNGADVDLAWTNNAVGDGIKIYRSTDGVIFAEIDDIAAGSISYTDLAPVSGFWYYYVAAYNSGGESDSNVASIIMMLLLLEFATVESAPLTSPYTEGIGQVTITDTGNKLSKASGELVQSTVTGAFSDPRVAGDSIERVAGRVLIVTGITGDSWRVGWADSGDNLVRGGVLALSSGFYHYDNAVGVGQIVLKAGVAYDLMIFLGNWGTMTAIRGGAWADWTMLGHTTIRTGAGGTTNSAALQKVYWDYNSAGVTIDEIAVQDWGGVWSRSIFHADAYELLPSSGDTYAGSSGSMFVQVGWVPASGTVLDLMFRRTDDDNTWILRGSQTGGTLKLIEKSGGVETERQSAAFTWGTGSMLEIWIRAEGSRVAYGVQGSQRGVYTSGSYNSSVTGVKLISTGTTDLARVIVFPLALPDLPTTPGPSPLNVFCLGDSKTGASGDSGVPAGLTGGYPIYLMAGLEVARNAGAFETPGRYSLGGGTSVTIEAQMDTQLAARAHVADFVTVNIGANDATAGTSEANFKAAYGSILDKCHAKWPDAEIYCMLVWVRNFLSQCNSVDTWIADVIADGRSAWAFVGPDERVFLENGDDGTTYTADGVHPNHAGYVLTAQKWQEAIG